jgi:hypothetical protein
LPPLLINAIDGIPPEHHLDVVFGIADPRQRARQANPGIDKRCQNVGAALFGRQRVNPVEVLPLRGELLGRRRCPRPLPYSALRRRAMRMTSSQALPRATACDCTFATSWLSSAACVSALAIAPVSWKYCSGMWDSCAMRIMLSSTSALSCDISPPGKATTDGIRPRPPWSRRYSGYCRCCIGHVGGQTAAKQNTFCVAVVSAASSKSIAALFSAHCTAIRFSNSRLAPIPRRYPANGNEQRESPPPATGAATAARQPVTATSPAPSGYTSLSCPAGRC